MLNSQQKVVLPHLCRLIDSSFGGELCDRALLERFLEQHDSASFAALVRRHGPMVLGVCRRILGNVHDAEDAFQAVFLVLARKARSIAKQEALGSWLYGVAYRVALKARADSARRRRHERQAAERDEVRSQRCETRDDLGSILDEEVNRLPDKYRQPIVFCYFEGKTYQEAARLLGWPAGTVSVRLARARELLRSRLALRGLSLTPVVLAARLTESTASVVEAYLLARATAGVAKRFMADGAAAGVSTQVIALTEGVVKAMAFRNVKTVIAVFLIVGMMGGGAGALRYFAQPAPAAEQPGDTVRDDTRAPAGGESVAADRPSVARDAKGPPSKPIRTLADLPPGKTGPAPQMLAPSATGVRPAQTRIGLINMTRVLKGSRKSQAIQADLRNRMKEIQKKLEPLQKQIKQYQAAHNDPETPAGDRQKYLQQIHKLMLEIQDAELTAQAQISKLNNEACVRLYREIEDAANRVAKAHEYELVMFYTDAVTEADFYSPQNVQRKMMQPGALMPMIVTPGMDITDTVIEALNRMYKATEAPRP
jgi:RNA polymerase sigma factor (sigma-70 family)